MISYRYKDWKLLIKDINYKERLLIATTLVGWKCKANEHLNWLSNAKNIKEKFPNVEFFAALELDNEGIIVFKEFIKIIYFTKKDNFDKNYKATRLDANKYSIDKWLK
jgi:hypothetical protein